jgi:hypothetical protein
VWFSRPSFVLSTGGLDTLFPLKPFKWIDTNTGEKSCFVVWQVTNIRQQQ